jgi:hypothetical protein
VAASSIDHPRHQGPRQLDRSAQVDVESPVDLLRGEPFEPPACRESRVRHEHVHRACALGQRRDARLLGEVGLQNLGVATKLGPQLVQRAGAPTAQQNARAAAVKRAGNGLADAAAGAREQDRRSPELHVPGRYCTRIARGVA